MKSQRIKVGNMEVRLYTLNTIIVGSGAAGLNAADRLFTYGQKDIAIVTEGLKMGTSRNTGSDKQTYYKLTMAGNQGDSIYEMARTLYDGGSMDGEIALVETALSARCFFHLVDIGVPFPHNRYGEYIGYKTDHDPRQRATSAGPLTSKYMTEKLELQVKQKNIKIFDGYQVIAILTDEGEKRSLGLLALDLNSLSNPDQRYVLFNTTNIVYATGGPAGIYSTSVYPESQTGASGIAFEAGVKGKNLTESQYGIASIKFRWNLSGTYQQVLPRYVSTKEDGTDEREFLNDFFSNQGRMLDAVFLKGYQWPFDPRKIANEGSSLIDLLVYLETEVKGRRVWLDYTKNPGCENSGGELDFTILGQEAYNYLKKSNALFGTPIERLKKMNQPAVNLYKNNGINLEQEYLEIAVCAQHNNGGLYGNIWWESNLENFFPVGEVNGTHGIYRPGGSALNSGQVGSTRAANYIAVKYNDSPVDPASFIEITLPQVLTKIELGEKVQQNEGSSNVFKLRKEIGKNMNRCGAHVRSLDTVSSGLVFAKEFLNNLVDRTQLSSVYQLGEFYKNYDILITQIVYLSAIKNYIEVWGKSRGSYLVYDSEGEIPVEGMPESLRYSLGDGSYQNKIQYILYDGENCKCQWEPVNPIPEEDDWFETVWNRYLNNEIIK